ncbi:transcriptional regulator [Streptomyces sparsogenes]|uniref:transcriptional regulator n=1 Tax=Streptomyces sparsogenes TaxID=67365 RepID=UPI0033C71129
MSMHSAIPQGRSLPDYARDLVRMHEAVIGGSRPPLAPRPLVSRSWTRMLGMGLAVQGGNPRVSVTEEEIAYRRNASPMRSAVREFIQIFAANPDASHMLLVVADADGVILWRAGASSVRRRADALGFTEGAVWTEAQVGTNAIGTALAEVAPVELLSGEHFEQDQHAWYCTACPVHDPRTGDLLGIIDISGPALTLHPAIGALAETGRRLMEVQIWRCHQEHLERLRRSAEPLLAATSGPALVVDDHGWVAHSSGVAVGARIPAPAARQTLAVPGYGACLPERLPNGWLVRPFSRGRQVLLELDLSGTPSLQVQAGDTGWRRLITKRHAEILALLHRAGPAGMSAEALSQALFGDAGHLVAARAEVSRLRRQLGGIVATRPYRLTDGVQLTLTQNAHRGS